jgi:hypothetical protein
MAGSLAIPMVFAGHTVIKKKNGSRTILQSPANERDVRIGLNARE